MCHKRVFKAKVVWRGRSQLRRYSRPRDLCRRVYLSSSHRSPLEEAFLLHRARGCELVIHGYIVFVFMILYLWFWICISKVLYFWMFVFVFVFCATQGMLKVESSWSMDPSQSTMAHSDKTALFTFSQSSYLPTTDPCFCFWIQRIELISYGPFVVLCPFLELLIIYFTFTVDIKGSITNILWRKIGILWLWVND